MAKGIEIRFTVERKDKGDIDYSDIAALLRRIEQFIVLEKLVNFDIDWESFY